MHLICRTSTCSLVFFFGLNTVSLINYLEKSFSILFINKSNLMKNKCFIELISQKLTAKTFTSSLVLFAWKQSKMYFICRETRCSLKNFLDYKTQNLINYFAKFWRFYLFRQNKNNEEKCLVNQKLEKHVDNFRRDFLHSWWNLRMCISQESMYLRGNKRSLTYNLFFC